VRKFRLLYLLVMLVIKYYVSYGNVLVLSSLQITRKQFYWLGSTLKVQYSVSGLTSTFKLKNDEYSVTWKIRR
jgi:hypothetical protein